MADRTAIFSVYNMLKARKGVTPDRLNKGLSLALKGVESRYFTNLMSCTCPDQSHRSQLICKHRLAYMMMNPNEFSVAAFENQI
jgi:hypothetical protein